MSQLERASSRAFILCGRTATAAFFRPGHEPVHIVGIPARLLTELGIMAAPCPWVAMASLLWPNVDDRSRLRRRLDRVVQRLRHALRDHGLPTSIVRLAGGNVELLLDRGAGQQFVDEA